MKLTTSLGFWGVVGIAAFTLLDATPSKAVLYIDFIPISATRTRIQASGTINPSLLSFTPIPEAVAPGVSPTNPNSSRIGLNADAVRFNYASVAAAPPGLRFRITGNSNPFTATGGFTGFAAGTTPTNNPPLILRWGTDMDFWLPDTFTGCTSAACPSPTNTASSLNGSFDVNLSLAQIGLASRSIVYTSGSEQIILRDATAPGPVPLLGAAAAFSYSRKLRNRIQKSIPARLA